MTPAVARPRFRTDLVAEPIQEDGKRFIDVFDPDSGVGFRFYEVEYSLACAMDGERDVAGLVRWAKEELGVEPSAKELTTVISTLGGLGYLSEERGDGVGLVEGVVSAPPQAAPRVEDVELGTAGANVPAVTADLPPIDMELGEAGGVAPERVVVDDFGAGPDLAAPARDDFPQPPSAAVPVAQLQPRTIPDSDLDGPTDLPRPVPLAAGDEDVSTDLSDHLAISASDVKEAVRASRVMQAVTVPADIAATLAAAEAEEEAARAAAAKIAAEKAAAEAAAAADRAAADKAAADKAAADKAAAEAAAAADKAAADKAAADKVAADKAAADRAAADKAAADKAADKAAADKAAADKAAADKAAADKAAADKAAAEKAAAAKTAAEKAALDKPTTPAAEPRTSRFLIFLLVVVIVLAGFYLVWTQLLKKPLPWEKAEPTAAAKAPTPPPAPPPPPTPPPPAPTPPAVLTAVKGTTSDVAASRKGTVATVVADGSTVAVGDVLVQFVAQPALTKQLAASKKRLDIELPKLITELTNKRDAAQAAGKVELAKTHQERLDKQLVVKSSLEAEVASLTTQLEAYAVRAQLAGTVKTVVAKGDRIENPEQVIVAITGPDTSTATFTLSPDNKKVYSAGGSVLLTVKTDPGQKANCTVAAVQGPSVTVACPPDVTIAPGTEVLLD